MCPVCPRRFSRPFRAKWLRHHACNVEVVKEASGLASTAAADPSPETLYSFVGLLSHQHQASDAARTKNHMPLSLWLRCTEYLMERLAAGDLDAVKAALAPHAEAPDKDAFGTLARISEEYSATRDPDLALEAVDPILSVCWNIFPQEAGLHAQQRSATNLRDPASWFPRARSIKRTIHFHAGPTNSGKTHMAIERLKGSPTGLFAGPLRLLALEVYERLNADGVPTSMVTGQEQRVVDGAKHGACTVEMMDTNLPVHCVVIDEIQMIGDPHRGNAFTRALLGALSPEIHVCGSDDALPALRKLVKMCDDELVVHRYNRMSGLQVETESLDMDYSKVRRGDCIVGFSVRDLYDIRSLVEKQTDLKCCIVYGSLPPSTRGIQAQLFNDPDSGYDVLVASDAVGMGLNLNIGRVIFHSTSKFDGRSFGRVPRWSIKQIGGRAGRRSSEFSVGKVTTWAADDLKGVGQNMASNNVAIRRAGLLPSTDQILQFAWERDETGEAPLVPLMKAFSEQLQLDNDFFACVIDAQLKLAEVVDEFPELHLATRYVLTDAPVSHRNEDVVEFFRYLVAAVAEGRELPLHVEIPDEPRGTVDFIKDLEKRFQAIDLYSWMSSRFPLHFPSIEETAALSTKLGELIAASLQLRAESADTDELLDQLKRRRQGSNRGRRRGRQRGGGDGQRRRARRGKAARSGSGGKEAVPSAAAKAKDDGSAINLKMVV